MEVAVHYRRIDYHPHCHLRPLSLSRHSVNDFGVLPLILRTRTRHLPRPRSSGTSTMEPRFRKESLQQLVLVRLRHAVDHRGRDGVVFLQLFAGAVHEVHEKVLCRTAQQLSNGCPSRRYRVNALLGHSHRFSWWQEISGWVLDWHHGYRDLCHDPHTAC